MVRPSDSSRAKLPQAAFYECPAEFEGNREFTISLWIKPGKDKAEGAIFTKMDDNRRYRGVSVCISRRNSGR